MKTAASGASVKISRGACRTGGGERSARPVGPGRGGFSTVELLVSLVLLALTFGAVGGAAVRYAQGVPVSASRDTAIRLATERLEEVREHPCYGELATRFREIEFDVDGIPDAYRQTRVVRLEGGSDGALPELTVVEVEVFVPGLEEPVERTATLRGP